VLIAALGALAACTPADPPAVALCKFALKRAVADPPEAVNALVAERLGIATVDLIYLDAGTRTTATCKVKVTRYAVRLQSLTIGGTPVPDPALAPIRADWASKEDAGKLYQL
jgi:hypothetical protein